MNNIRVTIIYRDGQEECSYVSAYRITNGCLELYQRYEETRYIPLDIIKEWKVSD